MVLLLMWLTPCWISHKLLCLSRIAKAGTTVPSNESNLITSVVYRVSVMATISGTVAKVSPACLEIMLPA